jgi:hypothetical protein
MYCHVKIRGVSPSIVNDSIEEQSRCYMVSIYTVLGAES